MVMSVIVIFALAVLAREDAQQQEKVVAQMETRGTRVAEELAQLMEDAITQIQFEWLAGLHVKCELIPITLHAMTEQDTHVTAQQEVILHRMVCALTRQ